MLIEDCFLKSEVSLVLLPGGDCSPILQNAVGKSINEILTDGSYYLEKSFYDN